VSTKRSNAAVILSSPDFASWLEDPAFVSELLQRCSFNSPDESPGPGEVSVLGAVVDSLCPRQPNGQPLRGFSIMHGLLDGILPGLWHGDSIPLSPAIDRQSSISVALNPLLGDSRALSVTIPLANTVFQNGRRSTLLASHYVSDENGAYARTKFQEKERQIVIPALRSIQTHASVSVPLLPITSPREVLAGLGNIVRQVNVDGQPTPASKELEIAIPKLLAESPSQTVGPVAVWALVIPPEAYQHDLLQEPHSLGKVGGGSETMTATRLSRNLSDLLVAGCRIHRVCKSCETSTFASSNQGS
jgi:hypothetical protein